jgi:hypothetical protein
MTVPPWLVAAERVSWVVAAGVLLVSQGMGRLARMPHERPRQHRYDEGLGRSRAD